MCVFYNSELGLCIHLYPLPYFYFETDFWATEFTVHSFYLWSPHYSTPEHHASVKLNCADRYV